MKDEMSVIRIKTKTHKRFKQFCKTHGTFIEFLATEVIEKYLEENKNE